METRFNLFIFLLLLTSGIALLPTLSLGEEFSFSGPPAFTITYPDGSKPADRTAPDQVWAVKTPTGVDVQAGVNPMPPEFEDYLKEIAGKLYKPGLQKAAGSNVSMSENNEITLADGTKAYYSELKWIALPYKVQITTMLVTACKNGKWVYVAGHAWNSFETIRKVVQSLRFK